MRKNKKQRRVMLLLILILSITIGFALLSTTLKINGSASILMVAQVLKVIHGIYIGMIEV